MESEDIQKKSVSFNNNVQSWVLERFGSFISEDSNDSSVNISNSEEKIDSSSLIEPTTDPLKEILSKKGGRKIVVRNRLHDLKIRGVNCIVRDKDRSVVRLINAEVWYDKEGNYYQPEDYDDKCEICNNFCLIS
tara:strand:- start:3327 stop:3728 length:402 start_codon:yes stop_codon:yes gene_type:complete